MTLCELRGDWWEQRRRQTKCFWIQSRVEGVQCYPVECSEEHRNKIDSYITQSIHPQPVQNRHGHRLCAVTLQGAGMVTACVKESLWKRGKNWPTNTFRNTIWTWKSDDLMLASLCGSQLSLRVTTRSYFKEQHQPVFVNYQLLDVFNIKKGRSCEMSWFNKLLEDISVICFTLLLQILSLLTRNDFKLTSNQQENKRSYLKN